MDTSVITFSYNIQENSRHGAEFQIANAEIIGKQEKDVYFGCNI